MRLIDANKIRIKPEYMHDICGSVMIRVEDVARIINEMPTINSQTHWIPCSERLPEEDHWLGGSGRQFSDNVLVSIVNCADEDAWVQVSQTIDGTWVLELPRYCKVLAWMPLPPAYKGE